MSLKKTEAKNNKEQTVYVTYTIDDLASFKSGTGRTLLEEIATEFKAINVQSKSLFDKQIEIACHYQAQIKLIEDKLFQTESKLTQTEAKLTQTEAKLDSCDENLVNKTQVLQAKEKELEKIQEEHEKLLAAYNYNTSDDSQTLLEEKTNSYEKQLNDLKDDLNQKIRQIQIIKNQLEKSQANKNEIKKIAEKLVEDLENANIIIKELNSQLNNSQIDKISLSRSTSVTSETNQNVEEKSIEIEMRTSLPSFTGRPDAKPNIGDWLYQSKKIMDLAKYTDAQMVAIGTNHLKDLAAQDYILHEKTYGIHKSWSEFSEFMTKRYTPINQNQIIRRKINNLFQITSIKDFYNDFRILTLQTTDMNEAEKLSAFINGMKPDIRKYVNMQLPKTLEKAFDLADLYETYNYERVESSYVANNINNSYGTKYNSYSDDENDYDQSNSIITITNY